MTTQNLLLVDDHPITVDGYVNILSTNKDHDTLIDFTTAYSCEEAYIKITKRFSVLDAVETDSALFWILVYLLMKLKTFKTVLT